MRSATPPGRPGLPSVDSSLVVEYLGVRVKFVNERWLFPIIFSESKLDQFVDKNMERATILEPVNQRVIAPLVQEKSIIQVFKPMTQRLVCMFENKLGA